jgi:hypothetical protein
MLRKLPGLTVRLFSSSRPEIRAREEQKTKRLVSDLGAMFARVKKDSPEVLTKYFTTAELEQIAALRAHHKEHRLEEHATLIEMITKKIEEINHEIGLLKLECNSILDTVKQKYNDHLTEKQITEKIARDTNVLDSRISILEKTKQNFADELTYLTNMNTASNEFLINDDYQYEIAFKLRQ